MLFCSTAIVVKNEKKRAFPIAATQEKTGVPSSSSSHLASGTTTTPP
jgi:hypothetical protein